MKLLTKDQHEALLANGRRRAEAGSTGADLDFKPVVKLFNAYGAGTWLLTELDPEEPDIAWGLADIGMDCAEYGTISLSELASLRHPVGFPIIERDRHWEPSGPISQYIKLSVPAGRIIDPLPASASGQDGIPTA